MTGRFKMGIIASVFLGMLAACAGQDDNGNQSTPPPPQSDQPNAPSGDDGNSSADWSTLKREVARATSCARNEVEFSATKNGDYRYENCGSELTGRLTGTEIDSLRSSVSAVMGGDFETRRCTGRTSDEPQEVQLETIEGQKIQLWEESRGQTCLRGDPDEVARLRERLATLQEKYIIELPPIGGR